MIDNSLTSQLRFEKEQAERAARAKTRLLASASHDLRQPLQSLDFYLSALKRQIEESAPMEIVLKMGQAVEALSAVVEALLDLSRLENGAITPMHQDFALDELLEKVYANHQLLAANKGIRLTLSTTSCSAHSDPALIRRAIENLVGNAIRYTDAGEVTIRCGVRAENVLIEIADTGVGLAEEALEHIFEEYVRLEGSSQMGIGFGLGLTIVHQMMSLLDHELAVQSKVGEGSVFSIVVPCGVELASAESGSTTLEPASRALDGRSSSVMLVDDDPSVLDSTTMLLESLGHQVFSAASGEDAISQAAAGARPDVLITDFRLPSCNGLEVVMAVRECLGSTVPAIVMTGDTSAKVIEAAQLCDCTVYHKPLEVEDLCSWLADRAPVCSLGGSTKGGMSIDA